MARPLKDGLRPEHLAVLILVGCFALMALSHARTTSAIYDEPPHIASGYVAWRWNDYRFNPEHPPLIKRIAALPLLPLTPLPADYDPFDPAPLGGEGSINWNRSKYAWKQALTTGDAQWVFAHGMLYGINDGALARFGVSQSHEVDPVTRVEPRDFLNDADSLVLRARLPMIALGLGLALLIFRWTRDLYGVPAALLALALFCFDPNFLAHASLVTTDVGLSLFLFGAIYFLWRTFRNAGAWNLAGFLGFTALAFTAKFSAALLPPMVLLILVIAPFDERSWPARLAARFRLSAWGARACYAGVLLLCAGATVYVSLWAAYGFRFSAVAGPEAAPLPLESTLRRTVAIKDLRARYPQSAPPAGELARAEARARLGTGERLIVFAGEKRLLPEAYLYGFAWVRANSLARRSFLRGEHYMHGVPQYFAWAFLLKTPVTTLLLLGLALAVLMSGARFGGRASFAEAPRPGYLAISATNLQGSYFSPARREAWRSFLADARLVDTVGHSIFVYYLP